MDIPAVVETIGKIIGGIGVGIGIIAGIVEIVSYIQDRRKKDTESSAEPIDKDTEEPAVEPVVKTPPLLLSHPSVPHNLPARSEFVGRGDEKARVHEGLRSRASLVNIDGVGGIGKTALALEAAHECLDASTSEKTTEELATFAGFIWTTSKDSTLTLNSLLDRVARVLDYPGIIHQSLAEKKTAVQSLFREDPYLLVVDNFETISDSDVRDFLLALPEPTKALITSRGQQLRNAWAVSLKGLDEKEALNLIRATGKLLGLRVIESADDQVLEQLYATTGGVPLAIKWAVGQIKQKGQSLDTVLDSLQAAKGSIFNNIFARSWNLLLPSARQVLTIMPLFAAPALKESIEAASNLQDYMLDEALGQLVEMCLVETVDQLELTQRYYTIHPLTRAFAETKLRLRPESHHDAQMRLAQHIESLTGEYGGLWNHEGFAHMDPHFPTILKIIHWCWEQNLLELSVNILHNIRYFIVSAGYWNDALELSKQARELMYAYRETEEVKGFEQWEINVEKLRVWPVAWIYRLRGEIEKAEEEASRALVFLEQIGDEQEIAYVKRHLGLIALDLGDLERSRALLTDALEFAESVGDEYRVCILKVDLARLELAQGNIDVACDMCNNVFEDSLQFDDPDLCANILWVLGDSACVQGNYVEAKEFCEEALKRTSEAYYRDGVAVALLELAKVEYEMGREQTARERLLGAMETYRKLGMTSKIQEAEALLRKA